MRCKDCVHYKLCRDLFCQVDVLTDDDKKCDYYEPTRPHGEWVDESRDALKCSACGNWVYKPFIGGFPTERTQHYNPNYCAFCGADMKEGDAE